MVGQLLPDHIPCGPTQDGVSLYFISRETCVTDLPSPTSTIFPIMINKKRSGAAPSTPNTDTNAIIFGHGVARDVRRAGKAIFYVVLARKGSYCDRNAAHRKFRSKNLGGSSLSIMATASQWRPFWGPVGRPKPLPNPQKSIGRCLCM